MADKGGRGSVRRWVAVAVAFAGGLAATAIGLHLARSEIACQIRDVGRVCTGRVVGEELVYSGLALLAVSLLTAVVTVARESHRER